jgi:UDP-glucose:(heptosyl)LPS alpha-1,3-glucosyltransferase
VKIGFVLERWGPGGGTQGYALGLARFLVSKGVGVVVWCARSDVDEPGIDVRVLPGQAGGLRGRLGFAWRTRDLPRGDVDVVQGFGRTLGHDVFRAGGGVHAAWLAASGSPLRRWSPLEQAEALLDRRAIESARIVVCNSEMAAADVRRWTSARRVVVVRNGVDVDRFRPDLDRRAAARAAWRVPEGGRVAAFFGSGFRRKGLDVAAAAFEAVARPDDRFVVLGDDRRSDAWKSRLPRALFHGPVARPEEWLPGADATLLPTRYDAAANTTFEALACGVPAVTSGRDGAAEIVPDPALVVPDPADIDGFARALKHAWDAPDPASYRAAASEWTIERNGEAMLEIYGQLPSSSG